MSSSIVPVYPVDVNDIFEACEYGIVDTGGGGQAWENRFFGFRVLITDLGGVSLPTADDIILVGVYASDDAEEPLYLEEYATAAEAVKGAAIVATEYAIGGIRAAYYALADAVDLTDDNVAF